MRNCYTTSFVKNALLLILISVLATTNVNAQYCTTGLYTTSSCDAGSQDFIQSFSTSGGSTNITNNNSGCTALPNYTYYSSQNHTAVQGTVVNFSFTNTPSFAEGYKIWVDYNADGDFDDAGELVYLPTATTIAGATVTGNFTVPIGATPGTKRLRIRCVFATTTFTSCSSHTYGEVEDYNFTVVATTPCSGTPTAGTTTSTSTNIICAGTPFTLSLNGSSLTSGLTYQWQSGTSSSGPWINILGATSSSYTTTQVLPSVYYQCVVTCTGSGLSSASTPLLVTSSTGPTYATLPYSESFEATWINGCNTRDIPNVSWKNTPATGNNSWRRNDDGVTGAAWTSNLGNYTPTASNGVFSARFHSYNAPLASVGTFDIYLNCNTTSPSKRLVFDVINTNGTDTVSIQISTNGGTTFTRLDSTGIAATWRTKTIFFTSTSATTIIRFRATSDDGTTDIGIDNIQLNNWADCSGTPAAGTASANPLSGACANIPITLSLTGATDGNGISYQWQSSTDGGVTWVNIVGATNFTATVFQAVTTQYRCTVRCSFSTLSANSVPVTVVSPSLPGGTYTIDNSLPTSWSGASGNFNSFNDAYNAIKCGISSAVIFNVQNGSTAGIYTEQLIMNAVPNASPTRTITFKGNGKTLTFASSNANERAVIKLKGAKFIIFDSLKITATGIYGFGVQLTSNADSNIVRKCTVTTSTTSSVATDFAGIVISGSETNPIGTGTTTALCDANTIDKNTIVGGFYGITLTATFSGGANGNNKITNNNVRDFYSYGLYVIGSFNTLIEGNSFSRPTRTTVGDFYGIYFSAQSNTANISKNKIFNPFGAVTSSTSAFYGINFNLSSASSGNDNTITNNLIYGVNGSGIAYGLVNAGSNNVYYLHNTISLDSSASTTTSATRGFSQTGSSNGVFFYNNLISVTRGGAGAKHCIYLTNPLAFGDNNNYYINSAAGTNSVGFYTSNRTTISDWKTAVLPFGLDQAAISVIPVYVDPSPSVADYHPNNAGMDNKAIYIGIDTDIVNAARSQTTPDIGAYEFAPSPCTLPLVTGNTVISATVVCQNTSVVLGLTIGAYGSSQTFQWQTSTSATGPFTLIGTPMAVPDTTILASTTLYYQCLVKCGTATAVSNAVLLTVNPALATGSYTINSSNPTNYSGPSTGTNFNSFADAKAAMLCGVVGTGNVIFNVQPGLNGVYNEQLKLDSIRGVNINRQVIFNGNGNTIAFSSNNSAERAVIKLNGADFITFDSLRIDATGTNTYGYGVQLINNADTNSFRKCTILASTTSTLANYAGVVINSTDAGPITLGNTFCDGNKFNRNNINGGYYGVTLIGSATQPISNNQFTNNTIQEFYNYGIYAAGTFNTLIEGNTFTRPTRTIVTTAYPMFFTTAVSGRLTISKNRITKLFGGAPTNTSGIYGIYHNSVDATAGNEVVVSNNLLYNLDGLGFIYGLYNLGSNNVFYYHNTVSIDNATIGTGTSVGFYQSTNAVGVQFLNNIITIRRQGNATKQCIYLGSTTTDVTSNFNNFLVTNVGTNNFIGFRAGTNYATLAEWQSATAKDANSLNLDPLYLDTLNGNYKPAMAPLDNKGTPSAGIVTDIVNVSRSLTTPDIGAYEYAPVPCTSPPVAGVASVTPNTGICLEVPIRLTLSGNSPIGNITFQWQASTSATGPWTNFGPLLFAPTFDSLSSVTNFYRCGVTCNGNTTYSTVTSITLNSILLAGTYTIDGALPQTWPTGGVGSNFQTVQSAVNALLCGMTGSVVFNMKGNFNEQIRVPYIPGTSTTSTVTFQSYNGLQNGAVLTYNSLNGANNYTLKLDSCKYFTFRNITISSTNLTNGRVIEFANTASYDSISRCLINAPIATTTANTVSAIYANALKGTNVYIKGNTINNGSAGIFFSGSSAIALTQDHLIDSNFINGAFYYGIYANYTQRIKLNRNTINIATVTFPTTYGIYATDCDSAYQISNNKININNTTSGVYGLFITNGNGSLINPGKVTGNDVIASTNNTGIIYGMWVNNSPFIDVLNNTVSLNTTGINSYGLYCNNSSNGNYYNNSVNSIASTLGNKYAAYFLNSSATSITLRNNIFSHKGGGKALYVFNSSNINSDYNLLYTNGTALVERLAPSAANYATLATWRTASFQDFNSIVYNPAFVSDINLKPNLASVDVWALHGRGVQITSNNFDHDNNVRPVTLLQGVPDLGAYEFYPTSLPTVLSATPATPTANTEQTFMYGTDTVMKLKWGATVPPSIEIRRYSGVVPTGLAAGNLDSMYFYTKVDIPGGGNYDYDAKLFYIDPWLGSIGGLTSGVYQLGLGKTTPGNAWVVGFTSRNDVPKRMIYQTNVNFLDRFTGLINPYAPPVLPDKDSSNRGRRFWFAYAANQLAAGSTQEMVAYLSAQEAANVQVKINGTNWVRNYYVPANTVVVTENLPKAGADNAFLNVAGLFERGISITSDVPIVAYAHGIGSTSSGACMLMPVGVWGYEYKTLGITQAWGTGGYSFFYIIADNDNTKIEVTPTVAVSNTGFTANTTTTVILNKGQVLQVLASSTTEELSGSTVKSVPNSAGKCFPIATFSGSSRTQINQPAGCSSGGDFMMQQNFPSTAWGKKYLLAPTSLSGAANTLAINIWRIAVKDPTTVVKRNGLTLGGLVNNQYYQINGQVGELIESDKPITIAQFLTGGTCGGAGVGDPEMIYISPVEQGIKKVAFYRNNKEAITVNYLTMIVPTNGLSSLQIIDGATVVTPDFTYAHPQNGAAGLNGVNYSVVVKRWPSAQQQVRVECDSAFTGITYGLGSVESYGYNMGTLVKNLQAVGNISNTLNPSGNSTEYTCAGAPFRFTMLLPVIPTSIIWRFSQVPFLTPNADVTVTSPVPNGTVIINGVLYYKFTVAQDYVFSNPGLYPVQVTYTHPTIESCDNTQTDVIYVQVIPSPAIGFVVTFNGCQGNTAQFVADNATASGIGVNQWSWTFNNGTTATGPTASFTYPNAGTFTEKLHVVTNDGCIRDTAKQVVVNPLPIVVVTVDSVAICSGTGTTFTIQNPLAGATYNWYTTPTGGTPIFTGTTYVLTNVTAGATYYIEGISSAGCISAVRKKVVVNLFASLTPAVVTVTSSNINSVTFGWAAVSNAASYLVSVNGGAYIIPSSGATGLSHTVTGLGVLTNTNIIVQAIGTIACQTSTSTSVSGCTNSAPAITVDSVAICAGTNYTYLINTPLPSNVVYSWYTVPTGGTALTTGGAYTINATGSSFTVNSLSPAGIYNYYVSHVNTVTGCVGTTRKKVVINVFAPLVKPLVTVTTTLVTPTSITFAWAAVAGATGGYEISINNGANWATPSSGANGLTHTVNGLVPNTSITILVRALGTLACQTSVSDAVTGKTLIDQIYVPNAFNPNSSIPANRTLRVYGFVIQSMQFMIFNQWGEKVFESNNQNNGWDGSYKGKQQPSGVYIYLLRMTLINGSTQEMKGSISLIR